METEVAGKRVVFYDRFPAKRWWPLLPALAELDVSGLDDTARGVEVLRRLDLGKAAQLIAATVQEWDFDGAPDDAEAVGELDAFNELLPLLQRISSIIAERTAGRGEAASGLT